MSPDDDWDIADHIEASLPVNDPLVGHTSECQLTI